MCVTMWDLHPTSLTLQLHPGIARSGFGWHIGIAKSGFGLHTGIAKVRFSYSLNYKWLLAHGADQDLTQ